MNNGGKDMLMVKRAGMFMILMMVLDMMRVLVV